MKKVPKKNKIEHLYLKGKNKKEIIDLLGDAFNFHPDNIWRYCISETWYGRRKILFLEFKDDIVINETLRHTFNKL